MYYFLVGGTKITGKDLSLQKLSLEELLECERAVTALAFHVPPHLAQSESQ